MGNKQVVTGVAVTWNDVRHPKLNAKDGPFDKRRIPRSKDDEFSPSRIVVDLKLDLGDPSVQSVTLDDVHIQIAYTLVPGQAGPVAGWWDGRKWVTFKQMTFANNIIDVTLPSPWPTDPPIGVGP
jgi:hypothetical protein